jgi:RNA polymerase sigma-70 factor (ECF subfamily)
MRQDDVRSLLADPGLRSQLESMVRRRVPSSEVDDIIQSTFTEALVSKTAPDEPDALRRWIFGVARNKVVDFHRRTKREAPASEDLPDVPAEDGLAHSDRDLLRWAEKELPSGGDAPKTLEWMLREGAGEKLEAIAASEKIPAPTVRQRVHRLRSYMKRRWAAELALVAALGVGLLVFWLWHRKRPEPIADVPKILTPREMARELRQHGLAECDAGHWEPCVKMLDTAAQGDPEGDQDPRVVKAREDAKKGLTPAPAPSVVPSITPTATPSNIPSDTPTAVPKFAPKPGPTTSKMDGDLKKMKESEMQKPWVPETDVSSDGKK